MKKHIFIFSALAFAAGLTAFGIIKDSGMSNPIKETSCQPTRASATPIVKTSTNAEFASATPIAEIFKPIGLTDFFYDFGPRFNPITKEDLSKARRVSDFVDEKEVERFDGVRSTTLIIIENDTQTDKRISGKGEKLSKKQLKMIESMEYSSHFLLRAEFNTKNAEVASREENVYRPHMTVVPETQASYDGGKDALLDYFRQENEKNIYNLDEDKLQPAKLSFTVTKNGTVENVELDRTSGYAAIDQEMIDLAKSLSGKWEPAKNVNGKKVDQVLVVSFGMVGC